MRLRFITSNKHKFSEVKHVFDEHNLKIEHLSMKYTELQADTTEQIALASAASLSTIIDGDFIIEDSGISVNALNNFPGPYSSYVYQTLGWQGILKLLGDKKDRDAYFTSVFVLYLNNEFSVFSGKCKGSIALEGRGHDGFGFDPVFIPENEMQTFAEMSDDLKNSISHRSVSIRKLIDFIKS